MLSVRLQADPQFITLTRGHTPAPPASRVFIISHKNIFRELRQDGPSQHGGVILICLVSVLTLGCP